jgi:uncharacterized SAM-binding protein YcdF (DUF218 family)
LLPLILAAWTASICLCLPAHLAAQVPTPPQIDGRAQEKVNQILQRVIDTYWNNGGAKLTGQTNTPGSETNVEAAFRAASELMPDRLDLRFGVASTLVAQAVQTNGAQLALKLKEALAVYERIDALDTNAFNAALLVLAYHRVLRDTNDSQPMLRRLTALYPQKTTEYLRRFERLDDVLRIQPSESPDRSVPQEAPHAIVVLGAGLETNGLAKPKMISRLKQCLRVARLYPTAPIILTGGNPRGGVTEAYAMRSWCLKKGIRKTRLWIDDEARDTVENALFVSALLQKFAVTDVTVVTSTSHLRRGLADLQEACLQKGLSIRFHHIASKTKGDKDLDPTQERLGVYRDALRLSGLWAFPGLRR